MEGKRTVTVVGTATLDVDPDRAEIRFEATGIGGDRARAHEDVAKAVASLTKVLDAFEVPERRRQTTAIRVWEVRDERKGQVRHYRATCGVTVGLGAGDRIGELIDDAVRDARVSVSGPNWHVSRDHPARSQAYEAAARDARARAEVYAAALGLKLGEVQTVDESGGGGTVPIARPMFMARAAAAEAPALELDPGTVEVSASVTVGFAIAEAPVH